jgi:hypothetical protein
MYNLYTYKEGRKAVGDKDGGGGAGVVTGREAPQQAV